MFSNRARKSCASVVMVIAFGTLADIVDISSFARVAASNPQDDMVERPELVLQLGHRDGAYAAAFSPDGATLASVGADGVKLWDAATGETKRTLQGDAPLAFSPDGRTLASGDSDHSTIKLWNARTGQLLHTLQGHKHRLRAVTFSPDGKTLASADGFVKSNNPGEVKLWDVASGELKRTLSGHKFPIGSVAFAPDGKTLASGGRDAARVWNALTGELLHTFDISVTPVAFSPDGKNLATGSYYDYGRETGYGSSTKVWDTTTGQMTWEYRQPGGAGVSWLTYSPNGKTLTSNQTLLNAQTGQVLRTLGTYLPRVTSPDGKSTVITTREGAVGLCDAATGELKRTIGKGWRIWFESLTFSSDGQTLLSKIGDDADVVRLWDARTGVLKAAPREQVNVRGSLSPDGMTILSASWKYDKAIKNGRAEVTLRDARTGELKRTLGWEGNNMSAAAFSPDGKLLATGTQPEVRLWDVRTGQLLRTLSRGVLKNIGGGQSNPVNSLTFSPDGGTLASGSADGMLRLWDIHTGEMERALPGHSRYVRSVVFSPDGKLVVNGHQIKANQGEIRIWDTGTGELKQALKVPTGWVGAVRFSPNGKVLASAGLDQSVSLWDVRTGELKRTLTGHSAPVKAVAFSPNGKVLVSGGRDGTIKVWNSESGRLTLTLMILPADEDEEVSADWVAYTPNGYYDGSMGAAKFIRWRVGDNLHQADKYAKTFHRPDLVQKALQTGE